ncbi:ABC transporter substrate-binding protein [Paenibacillus gallinarum]|nr:iron-siderophore ABC transporter substrate-binding protein [Paenibacillus gallinarum]
MGALNVHTKKHRLRLFGAAMLMLILVLAGCGSQTTEGGAGNESSQPASGNTTNEETTGTGTYTVKHAMDETEIKGTPQKVVILTNEGTEALLALGVTPVGAVKSWTGDPWYAHIKDQMEGVTVVGDESQPNLELIAGLQPDLIIGNKMRQEKVYDQLKAIAPTVMAEDLRGDWEINFKLYAEALNKTEEGAAKITEFNDRIADFKSKAGDKVNETVSVVRFMAGKTRIYHTDTFTGNIFAKIGLARTELTQNATEFVDEITKERLPEADADRLFYFTYDTGDGKGNDTETEMIQDPLWQNLSAVKNGRAYKVDDAVWNTAGGILAANLLLDELYGFYEIAE